MNSVGNSQNSNDILSDTVTVGLSPSIAMGMTYTVMADTIGMVMHNAVTAQMGMQLIANAATTMTCAFIISSGVPNGKSK